MKGRRISNRSLARVLEVTRGAAAMTRPGGQDWVVVKGRKANRRSRGSGHSSQEVSISSTALTESEREQWTAQLDASRARVLESPFYAGLRRALERQAQLVPSLQQVELWGLGSLRQPRAAHIRAQLGLVCLLSSLVFPKLSHPVCAIDPAFTPADIEFLNTLDIQVSRLGGCLWGVLNALERRPGGWGWGAPGERVGGSGEQPLGRTTQAGIAREEGDGSFGHATHVPGADRRGHACRRQLTPRPPSDVQVGDIRPPIAHVPTFFFLAHCGISVTEALLAANAAAGTLHNVVLLGNSLERLWDSWRYLGRDADAADGGAVPETIARLMQPGSGMTMGPVHELDFPITSAFNDLALHTFDQHC